MSPEIRKITEKDRTAVLSMMREFYSSPAVSTNGSEEIFNADIDTCLEESPYLEGYVFDLDGTLFGYAMLAKSFPPSTAKDVYGSRISTSPRNTDARVSAAASLNL